MQCVCRPTFMSTKQFSIYKFSEKISNGQRALDYCVFKLKRDTVTVLRGMVHNNENVYETVSMCINIVYMYARWVGRHYGSHCVRKHRRFSGKIKKNFQKIIVYFYRSLSVMLFRLFEQLLVVRDKISLIARKNK